MLPALVLAAGLGTRLEPLTRLVAKPAVPMAGRTLIERVLAWLHGQGVRDIVINLHHLPETITGAVGDGAHLGLRVRYSWEPAVLGSAGGPRHALDLLDAPRFLIVNGDTLSDFNLAAMVAAHTTRGAEVTLALVENPSPDLYNGLVLDPGDRVVGWRPKGRAEDTWHFIGVQVAASSVFAGLPDGVPAETMTGVYRDLMGPPLGRLRGFRPAASFLDVGTPRDYLRATLALGTRQPGGSVIEEGAEVHGTARLTRCVIWPGVRLERDVNLEDCVVAGGVSLPARFHARQAVIVPAAIAQPEETAQIHGDVAVFAFP